MVVKIIKAVMYVHAASVFSLEGFGKEGGFEIVSVGHELDDVTTPLEAGLSWVVKFSKGPFLGREVLEKQKQEGVRRVLVGLEMVGPGIARGGYAIFKEGNRIGQVTSGTMSPTLKKAVAMGYVSREEAAAENVVEVEIRGRKVRARVRTLPFYQR